MPAPDVIETYNTFVKSEADHRVYRGLLLKTNEVLLVSDPTTTKAAAGLEVQVGTFHDPEEIPGLAHLCQRLLMLGSNKYPEEDAFKKFISEQSGYVRAINGSDWTGYCFDILTPHLPKALEMFIQFFISPLFPESAIDREINDIDSEFEYYKSSEECPLIQLNKSLSDPKHPFYKFNMGNKETLKTVPESKGIDVRAELLKFYNKWYSANLMSLIVVGKESLDELEDIVAPLFSSIKDKSVSAPNWPEHPFPPELRGKRVFAVPKKDSLYLKIEFPIPGTEKYYKTKPLSYLSNLIGHEGPGSLLSAFKKRGWCFNLYSGCGSPSKSFELFNIEVDLTEEGINRIDEIITFVFQYIAMLEAKGPQYWIWEEQKNTMEIAFRFKDVLEPFTVVGHHLDLLKDYPMEDILTFGRLQTEWKPELISELLSMFTPENAIVKIISKAFEDKCTLTERWYGTKYWVEDIDELTLKKWREVELSEELHLPSPNDFIPSNLELVKSDDSTSGDITPMIVKETKLMRLWYKKDNEYLLPKVKITFDLVSSLIATDPYNVSLAQMLVEVLSDSLKEITNAANMSGLYWSVSCVKQYGINITVDGYNDKIHLLLEKIVDQLVMFKVNPVSFRIMKEQRIRELKNRCKHQPLALAIRQEVLCLTNSRWSSSQILAAANDVTQEQLESFAARFIRKVHIEGLMYGNLNQEQAIRIADSVEEKFPKDGTPLLADELLLNRGVELDKGTWYIRRVFNNEHPASCASLFYQCGSYELKDNITLSLLSDILHEYCYSTLKAELRCLVTTKMCVYNGIHGWRVTVQSEKHAKLLEERIEEMVQGFGEYLQNMSDEQFSQTRRTAVISAKLEKPTDISSVACQLWSEIRSQMYNFNRALVEVEQMNTLTKDDLMQFYMKHFSAKSPERQKLSIHVISTTEGGADGAEATDAENGKSNQVASIKTEVITDLVKFKSRRKLYPNQIPFINIGTLKRC